MPEYNSADEIKPNPDPSSLTSQAIERAVVDAKDVIFARLGGMEKAFEVFQADLTRVPTTVDRQIGGLKDLISAQLGAIDKDLAGVHKYLDFRGTDIEKQITHLRELTMSRIEEMGSVTDERFKGIDNQFTERDTRTDQRAGDTKLAVDAAFAAAKEATAKIEAGFTKNIEALQELFKTTAKGNEDKVSSLKDSLAGSIGDLKERLGGLDSVLNQRMAALDNALNQRIQAIESRTAGISVANSETRNITNDNRGAMFGIVGIGVGIASFIVAALAIILPHAIR